MILRLCCDCFPLGALSILAQCNNDCIPFRRESLMFLQPGPSCTLVKASYHLALRQETSQLLVDCPETFAFIGHFLFQHLLHTVQAENQSVVLRLCAIMFTCCLSIYRVPLRQKTSQWSTLCFPFTRFFSVYCILLGQGISPVYRILFRQETNQWSCDFALLCCCLSIYHIPLRQQTSKWFTLCFPFTCFFSVYCILLGQGQSCLPHPVQVAN